MERAVVLTQGGGQPQASPALGDLITQYSSILASQVLHAVLIGSEHAARFTHCCPLLPTSALFLVPVPCSLPGL